LMSCGLSKH